MSQLVIPESDDHVGPTAHRCMDGALAEQLAENSPSSLRLTKKLINGFIRQQPDEQIAQAVEDNARIRTTGDFREGITAFLEKRKPHWTGK